MTRITLLAILSLCYAFPLSIIPIAPRDRPGVPRPSPALGATIVVPVGGNAQAAINSSQCDDTIVLQAGATYSGPFTLPNKPCTGYITIQSSRASELPARVTPAQSALLAKLQSNVAGEPIIKTAPGAHHFAFIGVDVSTATAGVVVYDLVRFGAGRDEQKTLDSVPHDLRIDRSYIHGWTDQDVQRGISLNSAETTIINSYISDVHGVGFDTQAIAGWNGPGPYHIINNYLEGAGENVMFGGSDSALPELMPGNIEIRGNNIEKPGSWDFGDQANFKPIKGQTLATLTWTISPVPCPTEDQSQRFVPRYVDTSGCIAKHWTVKNLLELKAARDVIIEGNVLRNNWIDAQVGIPFLITVRNQDCTAPWSTVTRVKFNYNTVDKAIGGINFLGQDNEAELAFGKCKNAATAGSIRGTDATISNNLFTNIKGPWLTQNGFNNISLIRNTVPQPSGSLMVLYGTPSQGWVARDNVFFDHEYGIFGDGGTMGTAALDKYTPGYTFTNNAVVKPYSTYPTGNDYPATLALSVDFRSPLVGKGVDIDALKAAQAGTLVSLPTPSPTPSATPSPLPTATPTPLPSPTVTPTPVPTPVVKPPLKPCQVGEFCYWLWESTQDKRMANLNNAVVYGCDAKGPFIQTGSYLYCLRVR